MRKKLIHCLHSFRFVNLKKDTQNNRHSTPKWGAFMKNPVSYNQSKKQDSEMDSKKCMLNSCVGIAY